MLPVPLNSSKITSSMRDPVSIKAVAMIVSEPPCSIFRAAPKKRLGLCKGIGIDTARQDLARMGLDRVIGAGKAGDGIKQDDDIIAMLDEAARFFNGHFGDLDVPFRRFVESGRDDFPLTMRCISVTSSGRSSISRTIRMISGLLIAMALAMFCRRIVFPVREGQRSDRAALCRLEQPDQERAWTACLLLSP